MAMSAFCIDDPVVATRFQEPCLRSAESLNFFRGEAGVIERPDIFDDGDLQTQPMAALKAFLDVSKSEGMVYARWGAAKFVKQQFRVVCDNKLDVGAEPDADKRREYGDTIPEEIFLDMLKPSFPQGAGSADIEALLKRATWMINTASCVYVRLAGVDSKVDRTIHDGAVLTKRGAAAWGAWLRDNTPRDPDELSRARQGEQAWLRKLLRSDPSQSDAAEAPTTPASSS